MKYCKLVKIPLEIGVKFTKSEYLDIEKIVQNDVSNTIQANVKSFSIDMYSFRYHINYRIDISNTLKIHDLFIGYFLKEFTSTLKNTYKRGII
jgi:hypothetical protein